MRLNIKFNNFKKKHLKKKHQIIFKSFSCKNYYKVENLYKFLLAEKNSLFLSQLKKELSEADTQL